MDASHTAEAIENHNLAQWLMDLVRTGLTKTGISHNDTVVDIVYLVLVIAAAFLLGWLLQKAVYFVVRKIVSMREGVLGRELLKAKTLGRCCLILPPLVILALVPFAFEDSRKTLVIVERIAAVYALVALGIGLASVMDFIFNYYNIHENTRKLPMKGLLNIGKGLMWIILVIIAVSIAVDKSPAILLTGLGAFAAALMLVFKDSILGFVAGIQMSQNDMLHVGDWIVVPSTPANGVVLDVTLTAVKVQNFDNTIVTVPPYTLVSTSFQNYRGMVQSGARRIVKTLTIDVPTITAITPEETDAIVAKYPILKSFVDGLRQAGKTEQDDGGLTPINGTIETNLGLFRAYICLKVYNSPLMANNQQILIRLMDATPYGLPLEIYCFTATTDWDKYEAIQSALLEHLTVVCGDFGLGIYSSSSLSVSEDTAPAPEVPGAAQTQDSAKS
ncbi:MAG: mechanosensitive ion channel family protein [Muribaculaceae bacterium]|nr:mechanosensitive ion channel family protein [Muribaculaceae bacterium]